MTSPRTIDPMSCVPIFLKPFIQHSGCESIDCGSATGFVVERDGIYFLVTNYHVLSGRRSTDNSALCKTAGTPTHVKCYFHGSRLGVWESSIIPLLDDIGQPTWITSPVNGSEHFQFADVAILQIPSTENVIHYPVDICKSENIKTSPCSHATVLGYPAGKKSYKFFPIWVTGYIASEPELDYVDLPILLVNATTTSGMSGSPVFQIAEGSYTDTSGNLCLNPGRKFKFLGVYSGRISASQLEQDMTSDNQQGSETAPLHIGIVWKPSVINSLIDHLFEKQPSKDSP